MEPRNGGQAVAGPSTPRGIPKCELFEPMTAARSRSLESLSCGFCLRKAVIVSPSIWQVSTLGNEEGALDRARAILVQTATFGLAANTMRKATAISTKSLSQQQMTKRCALYLRVSWRRKQPASAPNGELREQEQAIRCPIDLLVDQEPGTDALTSWPVRVHDESGEVLYTIDVQQAEAAGREASDGRAASN